MDVNTVLSEAKPGDVIAFSGNGLDAKVIQWFTKSSYSHLAIVLDDIYSRQSSDILISESTTYTILPDFKSQKCAQGVQVHWLSRWLEVYQSSGKAWLLPLKNKLSQDKRENMQNWLWSLREQKIPFSCPKSVGAFLARRKSFSRLEERQKLLCPSSLFCSELVAAALQIADAVDPRINPATQTPKDVAKLPCFQDPILIQK